jgi:alkylation response protein AidB-like acyl-CoA dehydrogenase
MTTPSAEPGLGSEAMEVLATVHRFAEEEMRPGGRELDRLADPADVIADGSLLWKLHDHYRRLGIHQISGEDSFDATERALLMARVEEELGWGDAGLAIGFGVAGFHRYFVPFTGDQELINRYTAPDSTAIGCWAITEPDHGSDSLAFTEPHWTKPEVRPDCIARLDGDEWVISGSKAAWVSNGTIADVAALFCTIDGDAGFSGGGVCIVPLELPGVSRGRPLDKLGQRSLPQGEIVLDQVRVPAGNMVIGKDAYSPIVELVLAMANSYMGSTFSGVARAAYELALEYARERVQGGVPIIEHQSVKSRLFKMFTKVEAAQSLSRRVSVLGREGTPPVQYSIASKTFCTAAAFEVASEAVQIFGGNGLSKEYPIEKILRDARAAMIEDGCNEVLSIVGGATLAHEESTRSDRWN